MCQKTAKVRMVDRIVRSGHQPSHGYLWVGLVLLLTIRMLLSLVVLHYYQRVYSCRGIADALD